MPKDMDFKIRLMPEVDKFLKKLSKKNTKTLQIIWEGIEESKKIFIIQSFLKLLVGV
ncbi:hypothetical protein [Methanobrevibacter cuticularis]|uniref:hypothetical protein n=1 Tax=Methanobrevibacter cuticularis TaxID=47311 RepID=UPI0012EE41A5|nr:hypothetical protein [Methanobrevibacter cuticularis]